jgi:hypothetical protein
MPKQVAKSGLMVKYGAKLDVAVKTHADDPIKIDAFSNLPPNLAGIAQLETCGFAQYKPGTKLEGEYYFRASGVIFTPEESPDGQPVKGLHTSIMEPVCDTTNQKGEVTTQEEHIQNILNHMKKLAADETYTAGASGADLESLAEGLQTAAPFFRYSTSPKKDQQTGAITGSWERWEGAKGLENWTPEESSGVEDNTPVAEEKPKTKPMPAKTVPPKTPPKTVAKAAEEPEEEDLDALAEQAEAGDTEAGNKLKGMAAVFNIDSDEEESWAIVVEKMRAAESDDDNGEETNGEAEDPEVTPEKGQVWSYKSPKAKKASDHEVLAVFAAKRTANLKNLSDETVYKSVSWDEMSAT